MIREQHSVSQPQSFRFQPGTAARLVALFWTTLNDVLNGTTSQKKRVESLLLQLVDRFFNRRRPWYRSTKSPPVLNKKTRLVEQAIPPTVS
jgi:hypothetical protein